MWTSWSRSAILFFLFSDIKERQIYGQEIHRTKLGVILFSLSGLHLKSTFQAWPLDGTTFVALKRSKDRRPSETTATKLQNWCPAYS